VLRIRIKFGVLIQADQNDNKKGKKNILNYLGVLSEWLDASLEFA
jgi:hypothetical protein